MPNSAEVVTHGHQFRGASGLVSHQLEAELANVSLWASHAKTSSEPHWRSVENVPLFSSMET